MAIANCINWEDQDERHREAWICKCNITHFSRLLDLVVDRSHRMTLLELIAEQQAKFAEIHGTHPTHSTAERHPPNWEQPRSRPRYDH